MSPSTNCEANVRIERTRTKEEKHCEEKWGIKKSTMKALCLQDFHIADSIKKSIPSNG